MVSLSTAKTANKRLWLVVFVCHLPEEHEVPLWGEGKSGGNSVTVCATEAFCQITGML